jgi:membrane fusion protein (multidrug efflux system)
VAEQPLSMTEPPLSSDREPALAPSAPAQKAPAELPRLRRWPWWSGVSLVRLAVLVAAGVIVVLFATQWDRWVGLSVRQVTDDAYVRGDITPLSAKIEGYVRRVPVNDFQRVKAGDLLIEIEDDDYRARAAQAEADLHGAEAAIDNLKARKAAQHAQVTQAEDAPQQPGYCIRLRNALRM